MPTSSISGPSAGTEVVVLHSLPLTRDAPQQTSSFQVPLSYIQFLAIILIVD
jgi:hypothetical protein